MANPVCEVLLTDSPLAIPTEAAGDEAGAIIDFWGVVRGTENGAPIAGIDYEAHRTMAEHQLRAIARTAAEQFDLRLISIRHRIGFVPVAEASLLVRVGSGHRAEAFRAAQWTVDELKRRVPIWKRMRLVRAGATPSTSPTATVAPEPALSTPQ